MIDLALAPFRNAKQLSDLLHKTLGESAKAASEAHSRHFDQSDSENLRWNEVAHLTQEDPDAPPMAKAMAIFGGAKGICDAMSYWNLKDRVHAYQERLNISSVSWEEKALGDAVIRYPVSQYQLVVMPQDPAILNRHKNRVINFFFDFCDPLNLPLIKEIYDEGGDIDEDLSPPVTRAEVLEMAENFNAANFRATLNQTVYEADEQFLRARIAYFRSEWSLRLEKVQPFQYWEDNDDVNFSAVITVSPFN